MQTPLGGLPSGGIFQLLARLVVRRPLIAIVFWVAAAALLCGAVPSLTQVVGARTGEMLPNDAQVMVTTKQMTEEFHESGSQNIGLVVLTNERGLSRADEDVYRTLVDTLRRDARDVLAVQDFISKPSMREVTTSKDNKAWYIPVSFTGDLGSPEADQAYVHVAQLVKQTVNQSPAGANLTATVTGLTATAANGTDLGQRDLRLVENATIAMVLLILLVVYRNIVTISLLLVTIGPSLLVAQQIVAQLAHWGLGISNQTVVFMTAIMIGAGTDYAVFLISRYHEYLRLGVDSDRAVIAALTSIGKVIAASAATVAVTFLGMVFTRLAVFSTSGPALAISVAVAFLAAITLLPAMMALTGRRGWIAPRRDLTRRLWRRSGVHIARRPARHLIPSLVALLILAGCAAGLRCTYDMRAALPASAESNIGYAAMERHFPMSATIPQYLYVRSPHDLRNPKALADLEQMAQRISQLPGVAVVRGVTRPSGSPLQEAQLSWQAGEVGSKLSDASARISEAGDLDALTSGARQLADSLAAVRSQVSRAIKVIDATAETMRQAANQLGGTRTLQQIDKLAAAMRSTDNSIDTDPANPEIAELARELRSNPAAQNLGPTLQTLQASIDKAVQIIQALNTGKLEQQLSAMQQGANALADGSRRVANGVQSLADQAKQLGAVGLGVLVFQVIGGQPLAWSVPGMAFIVLVAVGADYNMLLISRIRDESPHGMRSGVVRTVGSAGGVITSAGLIFAASMFGMLFASLVPMVQAGFIIGIGLLLDTFLVRTVTVPALAVLVGEANWWPARWRAKT